MPYITEEDDNTFTVSDGATEQKHAKTPQNMAPGGVYEILKGKINEQGNEPYHKLPDISTSNATGVSTATGPMIQTMENRRDSNQIVDTTGAYQLLGDGSTTSQIGMAAKMPVVEAPRSASHVSVPMQSTMNQTQRSYMDPKEVAAQKAESDKAASYAEKMAQAQEQLGKEQHAAGLQKTALHEDLGRIAQEGAKKQAELFTKYKKNYDTLIDEYRKMDIKPKTLMEDGNIGQNIMAGLAIALGAVGASMQGSNQNMALQIMEKAIDRDLEAQKVNVEKKGQEINMLGASYQAARQSGMDDINAKRMAKADALDSVAAFLDAKVATINSDIAKNNGLMSAARIREEAAKWRAEATKTTVTNQTQTETKVLTPKDLGTEGIQVPAEVQKVLNQGANLDNQLAHIRELSKDLKDAMGPVTGRVNKLLADYRLGATDVRSLQALLEQRLSSAVQQISGAGTTEKEVERIRTFQPNIKDDPETFEALLDAAEQKNTEEYYTTAKSYIKNGTLPKDFVFQPLKSKYTQDYGKGIITPNVPSTFKAN